jgi:octaprenyl-diphosphate synthase
MGDYLLARAVTLMAKDIDGPVIKAMAAATGKICEGEIKEVRSRFLVTQTEGDYFEIIEKKTAVLMAASCEAAGLVAGAPEEKVEALRRFGLKFGTAFQIVDDLLDLAADESKLGKPMGHDLREGKLTLPLLHALACAPEEERQKMRALLLKEPLEDTDLALVMKFIQRQSGQEYAKAKAHFFIEEAKAELAGFPESAALGALKSLAGYVLARDY